MRPILNTAIKVARQTATQLVRSYDQLGCAVEKELQAEMTQRIQTQCFEEMQQAIQDARPTHVVQMANLAVNKEHEHVWLVMPLLGASNFMQHNPNFFVGIAYYEKGVAKVSVIYDCLRHDLATAIHGEGTQFNEKKVRVSAETKVENALLVSECPVGEVQNRQKLWMSFYHKVSPMVQSLNCHSLGIVNVIQMISSQVDAFVSYQVSLETLQLGLLLLKEAGALVTDAKGAESIYETRTLIAANAKFMRELLPLLVG